MTPASSLSSFLYPSVHKHTQSKLPVSPHISLASSQQLAEGPNAIAVKSRQSVWPAALTPGAFVLSVVHPGTVKVLVQGADERGSDQGTQQCIRRRLTLQKS